MRLSARTEYAAIAAAELARRGGGATPVGLKAICESQGVPANFLVHILLDLKRAGIVTSVRGAAGGYRLARPADEITLHDIDAAVEGHAGSPAPVTAGMAAASRLAAGLRAAWEAAAEARADALRQVTLADIVAVSREAAEAMYFI